MTTDSPAMRETTMESDLFFDLGPDPHRLDRTHVVNVRFFSNLGIFGVELSEGGHISWRQWCEWGRAELRRTVLAVDSPKPDKSDAGGEGRDGT